MTQHRDAEDPQWVYEWREQQEASLRASKGSGMTTEEVKNFVDGCGYTLNHGSFYDVD